MKRNHLRQLGTVKYLHTVWGPGQNVRHGSPALLRHRIRQGSEFQMKCIFLAIAFCLVTGSALLNAQGVGEFVGTVTDPSGAVIGGARVTATEADTGLARSTVTSSE